MPLAHRSDARRRWHSVTPNERDAGQHVLSRLDGPLKETALVEAVPLTGRTNQIRVHLWQLGLPIVGDPTYLRGLRQLGVAQTLTVSDPPLCLHAAAISFLHPTTGERVCYEAPLPAWASDASSHEVG